ncbi:MAG: hypothetical protein NC406_07280 [Bacteroides sp.]|nr:hypothetical protein [Bacteroides sp.]
MRRCLLTLIAALAACIAAVAAAPADTVAGLRPEARRVQFAWGAEFGGSIDLSAHDMSSIDFGAAFGLRYRWLSFAGVGVGANVMVSNSCRTYPLYLGLRTGFTERPHIVFVDVRGGVALNYLPSDVQQSGPYASLGVGFNLAGNRKFQSYIIAGYTFMGRKDVTTEIGTQPYEDLHYAGVRLGVTF